MQYKRWRLVGGRGLVNAAVPAAVLFLAACGGADNQPAPDASESPPLPPADTADARLTLPAVWSTRPLDGAIADIALSDGPRPLLAIAFEGRGFQLFNLEGERLGAPMGFAVDQLASGTFAEIDGAAVTVFPGIDGTGALRAYLHGNNLQAPVELDLPIAADGEAAGLCSGPVPGGQQGLMTLGFWSTRRNTELTVGTLSIADGAFTWTGRDPLVAASPLASCRITDDGAPQIVVGDPIATAGLQRPDGTYALTLSNGGGLLASRPGEGPEPVALREGLSVRLPIPPVAMDALGTPRDGGYPFGLIVVAGETAPDVHQAVFVDTTPLVSAGDGAAATE